MTIAPSAGNALGVFTFPITAITCDDGDLGDYHARVAQPPSAVRIAASVLTFAVNALGLAFPVTCINSGIVSN